MRKSKMTTVHNGQLWERLYQIVKVEEPVTLQRLQYWCTDVRPSELENVLRELCTARKISVRREWSGVRLIETYHYGVCKCAGVVIVADEVEQPPHQSWRQLPLVA